MKEGTNCNTKNKTVSYSLSNANGANGTKNGLKFKKLKKTKHNKLTNSILHFYEGNKYPKLINDS